jgi:hypothetical protein
LHSKNYKKAFQKTIFLLLDALTARNNVIQKLSSCPPPGDEKEKLVSCNSNDGSEAPTNRKRDNKERVYHTHMFRLQDDYGLQLQHNLLTST